MQPKIIKENYSIQFQSVIWKQLLHDHYQALIVEERDNDTMNSIFHVIDLNRGELLQQIEPSKEWWESIYSFTNTSLKTITYGESNGEIEGENEYTVKGITNTLKYSNSLKPNTYPEESAKEYFFEVAQFLKQYSNKEALFSVEYLEIENLILISYYIHSSNNLENHLGIFDAESGALLKEISLGKNLSGIAFDTFFVLENQLITIVDKSILLNLNLT